MTGSSTTRRDLGVLALSVGLGVLALLVIVSWVVPAGGPPAGREIPWWALAPAFALANAAVLHLRVGRDAHTVTLRDVVLVIGLVHVEPIGFVAAHVLGCALAVAGPGRQRGVKLAFNLALLLLEGAVGAAVYHVIAGGDALGLRGVLAALVVVALVDLLSAAAIGAVIALHSGRPDSAVVRDALVVGLPTALACGALGLLGVTLAVRAPASLLLLAVVSSVLFVAYRGHARLQVIHGRLETLHAFRHSLAGVLEERTVADGVLRQARELMAAGRAELHEVDDGPTFSPGGRPWWWPAREGLPVRIPRGVGGSQAVALQRAGLRDALAVPLRHGGRVVSVLAVGNRLDDVTTFDEDDLKVLETLAATAAVALHNSRLVATLRADASEREHQALHDALTGLPNRRALLESTEQVLARHEGLALLLLDVDRFTEVNDVFGHDVGDTLLAEVGTRLGAGVPAEAVLARLGSDEFAVLLPGRYDDAAVAVAVARLAEVLEQPFAVGDLQLPVTASVGSVRAPRDGDRAAVLLQRADVAMHAAKETRSGHEPYRAELEGDTKMRLELVADLRQALDRDELQVWYQPKVEVRSGRTVGAEALVRWPHPERGFIRPDLIASVAEGTGLIHPLTSAVLRHALADLARWREAGLLGSVSVNLSPRSLVDVSLPVQVAAALAEADLPAEVLTLEITETAVVSDPVRAAVVLAELAALGVHLSLDDFGTGESSLTRLQQLPLTEVKIDQAFVRHMSDRRGDQAIVRAAVTLGHDLGLSVVAEGVEDEVTLGMLAALGADQAQGFHLSRPAPAAAFEGWLRSRLAEQTSAR